MGEGSRAAIIRRLFERGRAAWPALDVTEGDLAARVGDALPEADLERLAAEDLFLACGCLRGLPAAVTAFEGRYRRVIEQAVAGIERRPHAAAEHAQALLVQALTGERPKLADYSGRGPLAAWLKMAAARAALNARRDEATRSRLGGDLAELVAQDVRDPELTYIKARYRAVFREAFHAAVAALPREQRAFLRLHHGEGLSVDALASLHGTSRATAHRRLAAARQRVFAETCAGVRARLGLDDAELSSLLRLVRSELDVNLGALLDDPGAAP